MWSKTYHQPNTFITFLLLYTDAKRHVDRSHYLQPAIDQTAVKHQAPGATAVPPAMAVRQLCISVLCMLLLQAAPFATGRSPPQPTGTVLARAHDDCYKTVTSVQSWCAGEFIRALFTGAKTYPIKEYCCVQLACIGEPTCAAAIRGVCPPPKKYYPCPPHQAGRVVYDRHG